jgi:hypothetical protein
MIAGIMALRCGRISEQGSRSFLKKRTKKLLFVGVCVVAARTPLDKSFCFFFQKEALP